MSYVPHVMLGSTASPSHGATFDSNHMAPGDGHDLRKTEMADQITDTYCTAHDGWNVTGYRGV